MLVVERSSTNALGILNSDQTALNVIRRALKSAETDDRIVGLAIKIVDPQMELAQAQELCAMIAEFRSHGKWTTAYMETAGEGGFGNSAVPGRERSQRSLDDAARRVEYPGRRHARDVRARTARLDQGESQLRVDRQIQERREHLHGEGLHARRNARKTRR